MYIIIIVIIIIIHVNNNNNIKYLFSQKHFLNNN